MKFLQPFKLCLELLKPVKIMKSNTYDYFYFFFFPKLYLFQL